jgi:hypothetical protein
MDSIFWLAKQLGGVLIVVGVVVGVLALVFWLWDRFRSGLDLVRRDESGPAELSEFGKRLQRAEPSEQVSNRELERDRERHRKLGDDK